MTLELAGRAALVTGAGSGIGRALAAEAVARGMAVGVSDVDEAGLAETRELLEAAGGRVHADVVDVRSAGQVEEWAARSFERFPSVAVVFSNAGLLRRGPSIPADVAAWDLTIDVNLRGAVHCLAAFGQRLVDRGERSQLVFTGSQGSFAAAPEIAAYSATKHAVWALAESVRIELAVTGVRHVGVSLLAPPRTVTPMIAATLEQVRSQGGEAALAEFVAAQSTPEAVAKGAFDALPANPFYVLLADGGFEQYREAVQRRMAGIFG